MNKKLLLDIFHISAQAGDEKNMQEFIIKFLELEKIPYSMDDMGNIYNITCLNRPLLNAHMDSVQDFIDGYLQNFTKIYGNQFLKGYGNIGADDKCGIYIILELLKTNSFNFLFTVQEESGLVGSSYFIRQNDISYIPYGLTFDRMGASDILCVNNDYGTPEFEKALEEIGKKFGYIPSTGLISDADNISDQISTCNLSVGYYNHHSKNEFVDIVELENALKFSQTILDNIDEKFEAPIKIMTRYTGYEGYYESDYYENYTKEEMAKSIHSGTLDETMICGITKKASDNLTYIKSLNCYVSPEGARTLYEDLERSGIIYEMYEQEYVHELEDGYEEAMGDY